MTSLCEPTAPGTPPGADASPTIPTQTAQSTPAGEAVGTAPRADAQRQWWRARLACGHDVDVTGVSGTSPAQPPTTVDCPRCRQRQPVEIYPLTALSDPDNVGWVREAPQENEP